MVLPKFLFPSFDLERIPIQSSNHLWYRHRWLDLIQNLQSQKCHWGAKKCQSLFHHFLLSHPLPTFFSIYFHSLFTFFTFSSLSLLYFTIFRLINFPLLPLNSFSSRYFLLFLFIASVFQNASSSYVIQHDLWSCQVILLLTCSLLPFILSLPLSLSLSLSSIQNIFCWVYISQDCLCLFCSMFVSLACLVCIPINVNCKQVMITFSSSSSPPFLSWSCVFRITVTNHVNLGYKLTDWSEITKNPY